MATKIVDIRVAANTSSGQQIIDAPSGWGTGNAALVIFGRTDADSTTAHGTDGAALCVGWTDGTTQVVGGCASKHNVSPHKGWSKSKTGRIILLLNPDDGTVLAEATWTGFPTDGFRISWNTAPPAGYFVMVRLMQLKAVEAGVCSAGAGAVTTSCKPSLLLILGAGADYGFADTLEDGAWISLGFATRYPAIRQCSLSWSSVDGDTGGGPTAARMEAVARDDAVLEWNSGASTFVGRFAITGFSGTGFTIDQIGTADITPDVAYLAIELDGNTPAWCGLITSPTGAAPVTSAYRGWGLTPIAVMHAASFLTAANTVASDGNANTFSLSLHDGASEFSIAITDEDDASSSNTMTIAQDRAARIPPGTIAAGPRADLVSYDADGMTLEWTSTSNAVRQIATLAIGRPRRPDRVRREAV